MVPGMVKADRPSSTDEYRKNQLSVSRREARMIQSASSLPAVADCSRALFVQVGDCSRIGLRLVQGNASNKARRTAQVRILLISLVGIVDAGECPCGDLGPRQTRPHGGG